MSDFIATCYLHAADADRFSREPMQDHHIARTAANPRFFFAHIHDRFWLERIVVCTREEPLTILAHMDRSFLEVFHLHKIFFEEPWTEAAVLRNRRFLIEMFKPLNNATN